MGLIGHDAAVEYSFPTRLKFEKCLSTFCEKARACVTSAGSADFPPPTVAHPRSENWKGRAE